MRLKWWEALLLVALAVGVLYFIYSQGDAGGDDDIDSRTGQRRPDDPAQPAPVDPDQPTPDDPDPSDPDPDDPSPDDPAPDDPSAQDPDPADPAPDDPVVPQPPAKDEVIERARGSGDVRKALEILKGADRTDERAGVIAALTYELAALATKPPREHPSIRGVDADEQQAQLARASLDALMARRGEAEDVSDMLTALAADTTHARWLEEFFDVSGETTKPAVDAADELSAQIDAAAVQVGVGTPIVIPGVLELSSALATRFEAANRPRARLRWLRKAWTAGDSLESTTLALVKGYVSQELQKEALAVTGAIEDPGFESIWRQRALISGWQNQPDLEAEAWMRVPRDKLEGGYRARLLGLLTWRGRVDEALPYALDAARAQGDDSEYEQAVEIALKAGKVEMALGLLLEAAGKSLTPRAWRERFVNVALLDLRYNAAIDELTRLVADHPEGRFESLPGKPGYSTRLEELLATREMDAALIDHYSAELARTKDPARRRQLRRQLIDLHVLLGNRAEAKALVDAAVDDLQSLEEFLAIYPTARSFEVERLDERAVELLTQGDATAPLRTRIYDTIQDRLSNDARRSILTTLVDRHPEYGPLRNRLLGILDRVDPVAAAGLMEKRALAHPGNEAYVRAWVERAGWSGDVPSQLRAREALRTVVPDDPENLRQLGYLLGAAGRTADATDVWRVLLEIEGPTSEAAQNLAESLLLEGRYEEAILLLEGAAEAEGAGRSARVRLAEAYAAADRKVEALAIRRGLAVGPDATAEDKLALADLLLDLEEYGEARGVLMPMLEASPRDSHLLLRVAQSHAWEGAFDDAECFLTRLLRAPASDATPLERSDRTEALYVLGELRWGAEEQPAARRLYRRALQRVAVTTEPTRTEKIIRAKIRGRLGDITRAVQELDAIILSEPTLIDTRLDLVDSLLAAKRTREARRRLDEARPLEPADRRLQRMEAAVLMREQRFEAATRTYARIISEGVTTGTLHADHGTALRESGRYRDAAFAYVAAIRERAQGDWVKRALRDLRMDLGPRISPRYSHRFAGGDRMTRIGVEGRYALCGCDRITLGAQIVHAEYEGERADTQATERDAFTIFGPELRWRFARQNEAFVSVEGYAGRARGPELGLRAGVELMRSDPYATLRVEARFDTLMEETGSATALGGSKRGVSVEGYQSLGDWWWVAAAASYDRISLGIPGAGRKSDGWATWRAELGRRLTEGEPPLLASRVVLSGSEHLDDTALASLVPLGKRFEFLTGVVRVQESWQQVVDATFEVYAGLDLRADSIVFGAEGRLRIDLWRDFGLELRAGYGNQDRFQDGESAHVDIQLDFLF